MHEFWVSLRLGMMVCMVFRVKQSMSGLLKCAVEGNFISGYKFEGSDGG